MVRADVLVVGLWSTAVLAAPTANSYRVERLDARVGGSTKAITAALVSDAFFSAAKARPLLGRVFLAEEYHSDRQAVVVIGYTLWQVSFGADPSAIGKKLQLNGRNFTVIGVMPSGFATPKGVNLWIPLPS
jgi:MacB-like periplasmic core domain